ncbi:hypothetical protein, partial [Gardnerella vaginalis]|uniref:hypothetical protein n=1 Tax=Gardnerella vaginalis TaxID=2702 RepID=UPI0039FCC2FF
PPPQPFYFKGFFEIFFSKILAILANQPPFLAPSSKHLYMRQLTFLDPLQCGRDSRFFAAIEASLSVARW